jgi:hypothetical protein
MPDLWEPDLVETPEAPIFEPFNPGYPSVAAPPSPEGGVPIPTHQAPDISVFSPTTPSNIADVTPAAPSTGADVLPTEELLMEALLVYLNKPSTPQPELKMEEPEWGALPFRQEKFGFKQVRTSIWLRRSQVGWMQTLMLVDGSMD